jgi:hypothetical protein
MRIPLTWTERHRPEANVEHLEGKELVFKCGFKKLFSLNIILITL